MFNPEKCGILKYDSNVKIAVRRCVFMMDFELQYAVDEDLLILKDSWKKYSHDYERMEKLFNAMIFKYADRIDDFADEMEVISPYEGAAKQAEALRHNVSTIIKRLEIVKEYGYKKDCLQEYYLKENVKGKAVNVDFNEARRFFGENQNLSSFERNEILMKIDEIEEICISICPKKEKWDKLRPYIVWLSGKDSTTGLMIISLIQRIN